MRSMIARRIAPIAALATSVHAPDAQGQSRDACRADTGAPRLDHVVLAVPNLDSASAVFRSLGFRIRDRRLHPDGLQNRHVKFRGGTGIELMTLVGQPGSAIARMSVTPGVTCRARDRVARCSVPASRIVRRGGACPCRRSGPAPPASLAREAPRGSLKDEHAARVADWQGCESRHLGDLYLRPAGCSVDEQDDEAERFFRRHATWHLTEGLVAYDGVERHERAVITYLTGELWRRIGDEELAVSSFVRVPLKIVRPSSQEWVLDVTRQQRLTPREWFG